MSYFAGFDLSFAGAALVIIDDNNNIVLQKLVSTKHENQDEYDIERRMIQIRSELSQEFDKFKSHICAICIEGISYGSQGEGSAQQAALNYYIRIMLYEQGIKFKTPSPSSLKKFTCGDGKGQAKKELMLLKCFTKFGVEFESNDLCDAYCLARLAKADLHKPILPVRKEKKKKEKKNKDK